MVYKGSTNIKPIYKGNVPIVNGYVGTKHVYAAAINVTFYASLHQDISETVGLDASYNTLDYPYNFDYLPDEGYVFERWDVSSAWWAGRFSEVYASDYNKLYAVFKKTVTFNVHKLDPPSRLDKRFPVESDWMVESRDAIVELRPHKAYSDGTPRYDYDYGKSPWYVQVSRKMNDYGGGVYGYVATSVHLSPDTLTTDYHTHPEPFHYYNDEFTWLTLNDIDTSSSATIRRVLQTPLYKTPSIDNQASFVTDQELLPSADVVDLYLCYAKWVRFSCRYTTPDGDTYRGNAYTWVWFSMHNSKTTVELPNFSDVDPNFKSCMRWQYTKVVGDSTETAYGVPGEVIPLETIEFSYTNEYFDVTLIGE